MSTSGTPPSPPATPGAAPYYADATQVPFAASPAVVIAHDQPCRKCGYNVRGLATDNRCPECGTPVGFSFHGDLLRFCEPGWVETLHKGVRTFVTGVLVIVAAFVVVVVTAFYTGDDKFLVAQAVALVGWALTLLGWWRLTEPDPSGLGEDTYGTARKIIRVSLIVAVADQVLTLSREQLQLNPTALIGLQVVSFAGQVIGAVGLVAQVNYLKKLALRVPDPRLSRRANFLAYALGTCYTILLLIGAVTAVSGGGGRPRGAAVWVFALVVLVLALLFFVMYLFLVVRMGSRFKNEAKVARSTWAANAFTSTLPDRPHP